MKKKIFRSLAALALSAAVVMSLGACSSNSSSSDGDGSNTDESEETISYIEPSVGDVLYSDDNCSITIKAIETNDKGGSSLTLSLVSTYDTSVGVSIYPYGTDEFEKFMENGGTLTPAESTGGWIFLDTDDTEADCTYDFSKEYTYFCVEATKYTRMATEEDVDDYLEGEDLYNQYIKISTEE